jgi:hypothetical protein
MTKTIKGDLILTENTTAIRRDSQADTAQDDVMPTPPPKTNEEIYNIAMLLVDNKLKDIMVEFPVIPPLIRRFIRGYMRHVVRVAIEDARLSGKEVK